MSYAAAEADLKARWVPLDSEVAEAKAALAASPASELAYVPIVMPHKEFGVWNVGERVEHPGGVFLCENRTHEARNAACTAGARHLGECPGTVGYVTVWPDGHWAVFEDILTPAKHLEFAEKGIK